MSSLLFQSPPAPLPMDEWRKKIFNHPRSSGDRLGIVAVQALELLQVVAEEEWREEQVLCAMDTLASDRNISLKYDNNKDDFLRLLVYALTESVQLTTQRMWERRRQEGTVVKSEETEGEDGPAFNEQTAAATAVVVPAEWDTLPKSEDMDRLYSGGDQPCASTATAMVIPKEEPLDVPSSSGLIDPCFPPMDLAGVLSPRSEQKNRILTEHGYAAAFDARILKLPTFAYADRTVDDDDDSALVKNMFAFLDEGEATRRAEQDDSVLYPDKPRRHSSAAASSKRKWREDLGVPKGPKQADTSRASIKCPLCNQADMRTMGLQSHLRRAHAGTTLNQLNSHLLCECGATYMSFGPVFYHGKTCRINSWHLVKNSEPGSTVNS